MAQRFAGPGGYGRYPPSPASSGAGCAQFLADCRDNLTKWTRFLRSRQPGPTGGGSRLARRLSRGTAQAGHGRVVGVVFLVIWRISR